MAKEINHLLKIAIKNVEEEIRTLAKSGGLYAQGLASEGYAGGYRDALYDVKIALAGVLPQTRSWWKKKDDLPN